MTVSLGCHVGQQNLGMEEMRALWRWLDTNGFDWISAWDHIYEAPPDLVDGPGTVGHFETVATLAALAADTTNARLGCLVFYVGYRNPGLLAKAAITIDHLSGGRFELGIGAGWHQWEAEAYGYEFPSVGTRLDMLDEAAQVIGPLIGSDRFERPSPPTTTTTTTTTTTGDGPGPADPAGGPPRFSFHGTHFRLDHASCLPPPPMGALPLWIGGRGERRTLPMAARYADGWNAAYVSAQEFARLNTVLSDRCTDLGRDPATIERSVNLIFAMGADPGRAKRAEADLVSQWGPRLEQIRGGALTGTPEQVAEKVLAYAEAGADMVNVALRAPYDREALEAYQELVMPQVRAGAG